ncbi:MAG: hypothetical protein IPK97_17325 [Ahniella sp.]|nr:hypothetical protein [Ahniella sp.]
MTDPYQPPQQPIADLAKPQFSVLKFILGMALPVVCAGITFVLFVFAIGWAYGNQGDSSGAEYVVLAGLASPTVALLGLEIFSWSNECANGPWALPIGFGLVVLLVAACFGVIWLDTL